MGSGLGFTDDAKTSFGRVSRAMGEDFVYQVRRMVQEEDADAISRRVNEIMSLVLNPHSRSNSLDLRLKVKGCRSFHLSRRLQRLAKFRSVGFQGSHFR